ncbi:MAG: YeeE/YedE family protein [Coriobacteriia bacterium]|nr:YeeE/YedE family protein [Coriobacteriia bacterium]
MMTQLLCGAVFGVALGFLLKRSGMCFTGLAYGAVCQRRWYELVPFMLVVAVQALVYHGMGHAGLITLPSFLPSFSLVSVALGSVLFGVGAVLAGGCLVGTLVKCGDGRIEAFAALASFLVAGYVVSAGPGMPLSAGLRSLAVVADDLPGRLGLLPLGLAAAGALALAVLTVRRSRDSVSLEEPSAGSGLGYWLGRKPWRRELVAVAIGLVMGLAFLASEQFGRRYGCATAMPLLSWVFALNPPDVVVGGCNPYDVVLGWGSGFAIGIPLGSLAASLVTGSLQLVRPSALELVASVVGGLLMGAGAMWGAGCLVSNGLVGTAQFSAKSWFALLFLLAGIWAGGCVAAAIAKRIGR